MGTEPAQDQTQPGGTTNPAPENSEGLFSFTPIKAIRSLPRLWERKPATPFRAGTKSRKLWKRFRSSFGGMQSLQSSDGQGDDMFQTAINASRDASYTRGVKRQRMGPGDSEDADVDVPGRSFLETKWESEAMRKRRKLPDAPIDIYDETTQNETSPAENDALAPATSTSLNINGDLAIAPSPQLNNAAEDGNGDKATTATAAVGDLTQEQEGTLVRSALRSSLDGEDAVLLNDFLSKAQAKRAAKAMMIDSQDADAAEKSSSPEQSPDEERATPRSRRALETLDTNSPSPIKVQVSPSKGDVIPDDEAKENGISKDPQEDESAPASPACRRSTRVKAPPANAAPVRNTIALRRAKGNEFVFLQRTEAQELALATKRNTRQNKGHSVLPQAALEAMAQHNEGSATDSDKQSKSDRKGSSNRRPNASQKHVSWNELRLAEYEDERQTPEDPEPEEVDSSKSDVGGTSRSRSAAKRSDKKSMSSGRSSRNQVQNASSTESESGPTAPPAAPAGATPRSRRVRRLGDSTMTSGTPVKTGSGRISKPPVASAPAEAPAGPSTPTKARRKLTPKSPSASASMLPAPTSKATTDQSFVSGIPTRSAASSEGSKRKSMIQTNAGCTPMPKRIRSRT